MTPRAPLVTKPRRLIVLLPSERLCSLKHRLLSGSALRPTIIRLIICRPPIWLQLSLKSISNPLLCPLMVLI